MKNFFKETFLKLANFIGKINKLSLPVVILIASIVLGGVYYASQVNKQLSIERQQDIKRKQECYDKYKYSVEYYYDEKDDICKERREGRESLEEIFQE
ncbi:MAG: hypothetical protein ABH830_04150 [Patescibacteria group bacterium]